VPGDALAVADDGTPVVMAEAPEAAPAAADVVANAGADASLIAMEFPEDDDALVSLSMIWTTPPSRVDIVAGLIGAEAGAAIGLLIFGGTPFLPIGVTFVATAAGPLVLRTSRPVRQQLFRRWLCAQLHASPQA
jgi:hypothetical protein